MSGVSFVYQRVIVGRETAVSTTLSVAASDKITIMDAQKEKNIAMIAIGIAVGIIFLCLVVFLILLFWGPQVGNVLITPVPN
jgi:uncharacterized membrane protein SpoIIM required for sporulation